MDAQWIKSATGRRVLEHWADPRPAWLWSADGQALLWRNAAARLFRGKAKGKAGAKNPDAVPIRGQIPRLIRLGSVNRSSLSRMQFLVGGRPVSATCACMPLLLADGETGLLVVHVDPLGPELLAASGKRDAAIEALFPPGADYLVIGDDKRIAGGSPRAVERYAPIIGGELPAFDAEAQGTLVVDGHPVAITRFKASPQNAGLLLFEAPAEAAVAVEGEPPEPEELPENEPLLPIGLPPLEVSTPSADTAEPEDHWVEPLEEAPHGMAGGLSSLFDRLVDDGALFAPLRADEDFVPPEPPPDIAPVKETAAEQAEVAESVEPIKAQAPEEINEPVAAAHEVRTEELPPEFIDEPLRNGADATTEPDRQLEAVADVTPPPAEAVASDVATETPVLYRVVGRGFTAIAADETAPVADEDEAPANVEDIAGPEMPEGAEATAAPIEPTEPAEAPGQGAAAEPRAEPAPESDVAADAAKDSDSVERVSRYNFDELSRILNDRVGNGEPAGEPGAVTPFTPRQPLPALPSATPEGALVTLGGETLVLNRLPLGIMVFRDQQVLFANRAITEMVGYESVESLRSAGLAAIFPAAAGEAQEAGPVNHLVQRSGTLVPVTARLQSVSWQGRPALMLSASATEVRTGHEAAVRAFAELFATTRSDGFIETGRSGVLTFVSGDARMVLKRTEEQLIGRPLSALVAPGENSALREFFERPARFAETARPAITLRGVDPGVEILLFAQGQAGIVSGYFGFVRRTESSGVPALAAPGDTDPALLARLSRGVRRPLNTVIGFSDLIGSAAFGHIENERYLEYARDIKTAGLEIAALVDELDDFARLRDGRYAPRPTDLDLAGMLESSVIRVRSLANNARVLVRSAISERLPRIRADRASLAQAVLNLLASGIDQTPPGGSVVLSAQVDELGGVTINVRDSAQHVTDLGERFVVFRDGVGRDGETLTPVRSSVGLALTRALLAVNVMTLSVDPTTGGGTLFSVTVSPDNVVMTKSLPARTP